jgi:hypothetical protein
MINGPGGTRGPRQKPWTLGLAPRCRLLAPYRRLSAAQRSALSTGQRQGHARDDHGVKKIYRTDFLESWFEKESMGQLFSHSSCVFEMQFFLSFMTVGEGPYCLDILKTRVGGES